MKGTTDRRNSASFTEVERGRREARIDFSDYKAFRRAKSILLKKVGRNNWRDFKTKNYVLKINKMMPLDATLRLVSTNYWILILDAEMINDLDLRHP